jgi:hypothetical protein
MHVRHRSSDAGSARSHASAARTLGSSKATRPVRLVRPVGSRWRTLLATWTVLGGLSIGALAPSAATATAEYFFDSGTLTAREGFASTEAHTIYFIESQADHNDMCVQPVTGVAGYTGFLTVGSDGACSASGDGGYVYTSFTPSGQTHAWLGNANSGFSVSVSYSDFDY